MQTLFKQERFDNLEAPVQLTLELEFSLTRAYCYDSQGPLALFESEDPKELLGAFGNQQVESARVLVWSTEHTLVPDSFWDNSSKNDYSELLFSETSRHLIKDHAVKALKAKSVFTIEPEKQLMVIQNFPGASFQDPVGLLIDNLLDARQEKDLLFFHAMKESLLILLIKDGQLELSNVFTYEAAEDALYYAAQVCDAYGQPMEDIAISGHCSDELWQLLRRYFKNPEPLTLADPPAKLRDAHRYNAVLNPLAHAHH